MSNDRIFKLKSDKMEVEVFVANGVRVFKNVTPLSGELFYSWEAVDHYTTEVLFRQPFTTNPFFAYGIENFENVDIVAKIKSEDVDLSCKVYDSEPRELPEIKTMYARRSNFFRFTNITEVDGVNYGWQVQMKMKLRWKDVCKVDNQYTNVFEYTFEKGNEYRVVANMHSETGSHATKVVAQISANDLEIPERI